MANAITLPIRSVSSLASVTAHGRRASVHPTSPAPPAAACSRAHWLSGSTAYTLVSCSSTNRPSRQLSLHQRPHALGTFFWN